MDQYVLSNGTEWFRSNLPQEDKRTAKDRSDFMASLRSNKNNPLETGNPVVIGLGAPNNLLKCQLGIEDECLF